MLLIIPQTRLPIQVALHKLITKVNSIRVLEEDNSVRITDTNWQLKSEKGLLKNLNQSEGKVIVINFWATWCAPCIAEMPSLQSLYDAYNNKVDFLFITTDDFKKVSYFKNKNEYSFPVYQPYSQPPNVLMTKSIPRTVVINAEGEIVIDESGAVDWFSEKVQSELNKLLK